jgi:hypothetical protein
MISGSSKEEGFTMAEKTGLTNAGKKEQRQYKQILDKDVKEDRYATSGRAKETDARTVPKQHSKKGGK